jgi:hypothetical protein
MQRSFILPRNGAAILTLMDFACCGYDRIAIARAVGGIKASGLHERGRKLARTAGRRDRVSDAAIADGDLRSGWRKADVKML